MKRYIFLLTSLALCLIFTKPTWGQATDTLVIIVDKDFELVKLSKKAFLYEVETFMVAIECVYYGRPHNGFPHAVLEELRKSEELLKNYSSEVNVVQPKLKLHKQDLEKYKIFTDKWISEQESLDVLAKKLVGIFIHNKKTAYVVFKDELDCTRQDSVTLHQVLVGFDQIAD